MIVSAPFITLFLENTFILLKIIDTYRVAASMPMASIQTISRAFLICILFLFIFAEKCFEPIWSEKHDIFASSYVGAIYFLKMQR